jgi:hypothetical protein
MVPDARFPRGRPLDGLIQHDGPDSTSSSTIARSSSSIACGRDIWGTKSLWGWMATWKGVKEGRPWRLGSA